MKAFIVWIGLLASVCLQSIVTGIIFDPDNKEEYLKEINDIRRKYAKENKVPNMNKLIWEDGLSMQAWLDDRAGYGETMRYNYRDGNEDARNFEKSLLDNFLIKKLRVEIIKKAEKEHVYALEALIPKQQRIDCVAFHEEVKENGKTLIYETVCHLEPEGNLNSFEMTPGEAGSACDVRFENDDGLCSPVQTTTPQPETTTSEPEPTTTEPEVTTTEPDTTTPPLEPITSESTENIPEPKMTPPKSKTAGPKPTAPPKPSDIESDSDSEPSQESNLPTDGASYSQIGMSLIIVFSMIFEYTVFLCYPTCNKGIF